VQCGVTMTEVPLVVSSDPMEQERRSTWVFSKGLEQLG